MLTRTFTTVLLCAVPILAQRPSDVSICDYYTNALLHDSSPATQYTVLTLLVNTVVIGNYTQPNVGIAVPGILAPGVFNGEDVNLLPFFNGCLNSTNRNDSAVNRNFLDGGGALPLTMNMPGNVGSRQAALLTSLYSFFGRLLGCSGYGQMGFPAYNRTTSMYTVHRFMALKPSQVGYFIQQVGLAAASFGVADEDVQAVGCALSSTFGYRCSPPTDPLTGPGPSSQSICTAEDCPVEVGGVCALYPGGSGISPEPAENTPGCRRPV